jgi:hypothetical protein
LHHGNVLQAAMKAVTQVDGGRQRAGKGAAKERQTGGKQAAMGGKKPAKQQYVAWPGCCLQSFHHVVIASSRRIGSWSF